MHRDEIHHVPQREPVPEIAHSAAQDQAQAQTQHPFTALQLRQPYTDYDAGHDSNPGEKPALPASGVTEKAECRPRIVLQGEIEHRQYCHRPTILELIHGHALGPLIQANHHHGQESQAAKRGQSGKFTLLPVTVDILDTAATEGGVNRVATDILAPMPTAFTLLRRTGDNLQSQALQFGMGRVRWCL